MRRSMFKNGLVGIGLALAITAGSAVGPAQAQAAPSSARVNVTTAAEPHWVYYTWYWTWDNCLNAGRGMFARGEVDVYKCQQDGTWPVVNLYVMNF